MREPQEEGVLLALEKLAWLKEGAECGEEEYLL